MVHIKILLFINTIISLYFMNKYYELKKKDDDKSSQPSVKHPREPSEHPITITIEDKVYNIFDDVIQVHEDDVEYFNSWFEMTYPYHFIKKVDYVRLYQGTTNKHNISIKNVFVMSIGKESVTDKYYDIRLSYDYFVNLGNK